VHLYSLSLKRNELPFFEPPKSNKLLNFKNLSTNPTNEYSEPPVQVLHNSQLFFNESNTDAILETEIFSSIEDNSDLTQQFSNQNDTSPLYETQIGNISSSDTQNEDTSLKLEALKESSSLLHSALNKINCLQNSDASLSLDQILSFNKQMVEAISSLPDAPNQLKSRLVKSQQRKIGIHDKQIRFERKKENRRPKKNSLKKPTSNEKINIEKLLNITRPIVSYDLSCV
jgi:hypothetical protein